MAGEAQVVTRRGQEAVVVIPYQEYERLQGGSGTAWDLFTSAPRIEADDLPLTRDAAPVRSVELT